MSFCGLGADHALEQINHSMKVSGGLVGITLNPNARNKFFLTVPELSRLADEAKEMAGATANDNINIHHHTLADSVISREKKSIEQLLTTMENFTNPFSLESDQLFNLVTKVVMPDQVKNDLMEQTNIGQDLFGVFVKDRIQTGKVSIWEPMKKRKLQTWKKAGKKIKIIGSTETVELREDRNLFARMYMLLVCKTRPQINIKEAVGTYEFTVVPRSMLSVDGSMLHCSLKSSLMRILEKLPAIAPDHKRTCLQ